MVGWWEDMTMGVHENIKFNQEVGGSIRISNMEKTVNASRRVSIAKEESALEKTSRRRDVKKTVVWKTFRSFVFLICLISLIIQSVEFFNIYYKYPTTIVTEATAAKEFKLPAITFCFRNTISFKDFCSYEPDQCEKPRNMEEFCRKHGIDCRNGTTNLTEKEEHLLPPPYQTDCRDNGPSEDAEESTNPNSFQMCLDLCRSEYSKASYRCDIGMTMVSSVRDVCISGKYKRRGFPSVQERELLDKRLICFQNCKQGCLKLQYKYKIKETEDLRRDTCDYERGYNTSCILAHEKVSGKQLAKMAEKVTF
ncbi:hypothetical protein AVEN_202874-1 [Araneus ventricosus]|uniref:Uncharacterized protein n=1 Tax=Araneus ventricosus TaxID=182803 RepID=A0A4Y2FLN0_ARAVE|nr:hypothetical protein AVEN_202874-1 [Araneus ventricosus]